MGDGSFGGREQVPSCLETRGGAIPCRALGSIVTPLLVFPQPSLLASTRESPALTTSPFRGLGCLRFVCSGANRPFFSVVCPRKMSLPLLRLLSSFSWLYLGKPVSQPRWATWSPVSLYGVGQIFCLRAPTGLAAQRRVQSSAMTSL